MAGDVSWESFSCYGAKDYPTPNVDTNNDGKIAAADKRK
jgi:hypothetical protein